MTMKISTKNEDYNHDSNNVRGQFLSYEMMKYDKNFNFIKYVLDNQSSDKKSSSPMKKHHDSQNYSIDCTHTIKARHI